MSRASRAALKCCRKGKASPKNAEIGGPGAAESAGGEVDPGESSKPRQGFLSGLGAAFCADESGRDAKPTGCTHNGEHPGADHAMQAKIAVWSKGDKGAQPASRQEVEQKLEGRELAKAEVPGSTGRKGRPNTEGRKKRASQRGLRGRRPR